MLAPKRALFIGSKSIGLQVLQAMHARSPGSLLGAITIDDRADRRSAHAGFVEFGSRMGLPLAIATERQHAEDLVCGFAPDVCVVVGWYWLISGQTLASVPHGFIGIHHSRLPSYRGGSPLVWQMINGERRAGFSVFQLGNGIDDGPVWAQGSVPIGRSETIGDVMRKVEASSLTAFKRAYTNVMTGKGRPRKQSISGLSYCAQRVEADGLVDWSQPASKIHDFVRAQSDPYPGAFTLLGGSKLTIWRAQPSRPPGFGSVGQVIRITPEGVHVACGAGTSLTLLEVEISGNRGPATSIIRSTKQRLGML
jgi:methionyl-tRNA formyltransferase